MRPLLQEIAAYAVLAIYALACAAAALMIYAVAIASALFPEETP